jgi:hypothetical protein
VEVGNLGPAQVGGQEGAQVQQSSKVRGRTRHSRQGRGCPEAGWRQKEDWI